jgi:uncharacterized FAD-dependent dehydrogenase
MQQQFTFKLQPHEVADEAIITQYIAAAAATQPQQVFGFHILKQSIDARSKQVWFNLTVNAFINEPYQQRTNEELILKDVSNASQKVVVVGAGPCGLFAAFTLIEQGIQPIIIERGKDVKARRRDLAQLNKQGEVNPESNYCFGEGGAGTYSDGKLYTRSKKRGSINRILNIFVQYGAEEKILYQAHPHIGTNKLPQIITTMRQAIIAAGGIVLFENKLSGFVQNNATITAIKTFNGDVIDCHAVILATGHSARDVFEMLHQNNILIEAKPFALGVRVEHPQSLIDRIQYHCNVRENYLPPASYSLVQQVNNRGVFSFCMCPGGIIAPAATAPGELVVNGWSPSKRNNPYANSGMVVSVELSDIAAFFKKEKITIEPTHPLAAMYLQQRVEQKAFMAGGGKFVAPAQRMVDFVHGKISSSLPDCSYIPGLASSPLQQVLPQFVHNGLQQAFAQFGKKMNGYFTNEAVLVATESRTSSPVRIPRNDLLQHPQIKNLYPAGEGAGYAGGIVSAAIDGENVAMAITQQLKN